jgi:hypothetical protein
MPCPGETAVVSPGGATLSSIASPQLLDRRRATDEHHDDRVQRRLGRVVRAPVEPGRRVLTPRVQVQRQLRRSLVLGSLRQHEFVALRAVLKLRSRLEAPGSCLEYAGYVPSSKPTASYTSAARRSGRTPRHVQESASATRGPSKTRLMTPKAYSGYETFPSHCSALKEERRISV